MMVILLPLPGAGLQMHRIQAYRSPPETMVPQITAPIFHAVLKLSHHVFNPEASGAPASCS
jgi:hypothetical protein